MRLAAVVLAASLHAQVSVPRPAPEFRIAEPNGRPLSLASLRGRVVLVAFVLTTCTHCQRASRTFQRLDQEFGSRGFDVVEAAFDEHADTAAYAKQLGLRFPVGITGRAEAFRFLGLRADQRIGTPQVVLIDRGGTIRAQSAPEGSPMLQSEEVLRGLIRALLAQGRRG